MNQTIALPIRTERLLLRPFTRGDVDAVYAYRQREDVARFLFDRPMSRETCEEAVQNRIGQLAFAIEGDRITLAAERLADGLLIGELTLICRSIVSAQAELGYIINPDFHGQGFATEAARALVAAGFAELGVHRIYARCNVENAASYRVMERLGMRREALFRENALVKGAWEDEFIYGVLAKEWAARG